MSDACSRSDVGPLTITGPDTPLRRAVGRFLQDLHDRSYSVHTIRLRRKYLGNLARWLDDQGIGDPKAVTRRTLNEHRTWLRAESGLSLGVQAGILTSVRMLFRFLIHEEEIEADPALHLDLPRLPRALPTCILTREEVDQVLAQPGLHTMTGVRDRAIMETFFATGIRRMELIRLAVGDVDRERGLLTVRRGKGGRGRVVPISERALTWIGRYLQVRPQGTGEDRDTLFLTRAGERLGAVTLSENVRKYVISAGIDKEGSTHMFRATTATMMLEGGADIRYVQEMLGHVNIETTAIYTRVSIGTLQRIYGKTHPSADGDGQETVRKPFQQPSWLG